MTVGDYDPALPLIIDPIVFATYLGGTSDDLYPRMALSQDESPVITGTTISTDFPVTPGAYQSEKEYAYDIIISKLDPTLSTMVFSTYLGGNSTENCSDIDVGQDGSIFVVGHTSSTDFPVTEDAFQTTNPGGVESGFISKLSADGTALSFSSYIGGSGTDQIYVVMADQAGYTYLTGYTDSPDFPITSGTIYYPGSLFVVKFNQTATDLIYSTRFPSGYGCDIAIDEVGNTYLTGIAYDNHPVTPGAFQTQPQGSSNAFVTILNPTATEILYSTYLTGNQSDKGQSIKIAQNGEIIVGGWTFSNNFPITPGSCQPTYGGNQDGFVVRLDPTCSQMIWGTYLGGFNIDFIQAMSLDNDENVIITGTTESDDFPITTDYYGGTFELYIGGFVSVISNDGFILPYSAFIGSDYSTEGTDIAVKDNGNIVITGTTTGGFLTTPGAFQPNHNGDYWDYYLMEVFPVNCQTTCNTTVLNHVSCNGGSDGQALANPSGGIEPYYFLWSNGQTSQIATGLNAGNYSVEVTDSIGCTAEASITITQPTLLVLSSLQIFPASCADSPDGSATVQAGGGTPPYTYLWGNGETGYTATALLSGDNNLTITDSNDCEEEVDFYVGYIQPFNNEVICAVSSAGDPQLNKVVWEKTEGVRTIAYNIYRESSDSGVYELIGSTPFNEPPMFEDITANPAQQSYRYKLSVVDSCQEESSLSNYHRTIHLTMNIGINGEVNLLWSPYQGFSYSTFYVMRSVENGPYQMIGQLPSTNFSFSDINPPAGLKKYMIQIDAPENCGLPGMRVSSNVVIDQEVGIGSQDMDLRLMVVPNPGDGIFNIQFPDGFRGQKVNVQVLNSLGGCISETELPAVGEAILIDISGQPAGIYLFKTQSPVGVFVERVVKW
jgi:hypothetical protein